MTIPLALKLTLACFALLISVTPASAQPLYRDFYSVEFLLGNSPNVFLGTPTSFKQYEKNGVGLIELEVTIDETLKGIHEARKTVVVNTLFRSAKEVEQMTINCKRYVADESKCLVLFFQNGPTGIPTSEFFGLDSQDDLKVVTKDLKFISDPTTLVNTCKTHCKNHPGVMMTQGVKFALSPEFANKHFSWTDVMLWLPVDPSLEQFARLSLDSNIPQVKRSAQRALKYFEQGKNASERENESNKSISNPN